MVANGLGSSVMPARTGDYEFPKTIRAIPFGKPRNVFNVCNESGNEQRNENAFGP